jgi:hypothetical protein
LNFKHVNAAYKANILHERNVALTSCNCTINSVVNLNAFALSKSRFRTFIGYVLWHIKANKKTKMHLSLTVNSYVLPIAANC